ncbi:MAG: alanine racemase [Kiritimatiellae bacterium]|nr:alanine racemase [Kiritimatiellia bacterium]
MEQPSQPRVWVEIDLAALRENFRRIAAAAAPARVMAVVKANAYGLGCVPVARALAEEGVARLGVACLQEALELKPLGLPVQVLSAVLPDEIPELVRHDVVFPLTDLATARLIGAEAVRQGRVARGHFKVDTGMGRLGIPLAVASETIRAAWRMPGLVCEGICSHFPVSTREGGASVAEQIAALQGLIEALARDGIVFDYRHIGNSDATGSFPAVAQPPFNLVRTGIALYGACAEDVRRRLGLRQAFTLKARLAAVRRMPEGHTIGYNRTCRLPRDTLVGTVAAGYADGLPLALSNRGCVLVRGRACPVLGRLSMDYMTVSLEDCPDAGVGDEAVCLGGAGPLAIGADEWARLKGTHAYDILCALGPRVQRRYG